MRPTARSVGTARPPEWHGHHHAVAGTPPDAQRSYRVGMPQMAVGGLAEGWLLREMGDLHWEGVAAAHGRRPNAIVDGAGNRLYPTFVRARWEGNEPLFAYGENERLRLGSDLTRFGSSMFFAEHELRGAGRRIVASTMTVLVARYGHRNRDLRRGQPRCGPDRSVPEHDAMPSFGTDYRRIRDDDAAEMALGGETFSLTDASLLEMPYTINPYHDINGVSLLYFAAYPLINDTCERAAAHAHPETFGAVDDWATSSSTLARDVFYLGNCDVRDRLTYRLCSIEPAGSNRLKLVSCLYRVSDGAKVAVILTLKELAS